MVEYKTDYVYTHHMVEQKNELLDNVFHALGDSTRRGMVRRLARRDCTVTELAAPFPISLAAVSKHIKVLEKAGLLRRTVQGRKHICHLNIGILEAGMKWIRYEAFWDNQLNYLEHQLNISETELVKEKGEEA